MTPLIALIKTIKALQIITSIGVIAFVWLVYPGAMLLFATAAGAIYVAAAVAAWFDRRFAVLLAFVFTILAAVLSTTGVLRFVDSGFDFLGGGFEGFEEFYVVPYFLLAIALASNLITLLHVASWRWTLFGRYQD